MRRTQVKQRLLTHPVPLLCSALLVFAGCGDDDTANPDAPATSSTLKALSAKELTALCKDLLPIVRSASTPAHQCTELGVDVSEDEATCAATKQRCLMDKTYNDWSKATCKDFAADGGKPSYTCSTKISEIKSCYDAAAKWLNALNCKAADPDDTSIEPPPSCFEKLQTGECKFKLVDLMEDKDFLWSNSGNAYMCTDAGKDYDYDLGLGDACNACATAAKTGCCSSWIDCVNDEGCRCYADCPSSDDQVCYKQCGITDTPAAFEKHVQCIADTCTKECEL